jgi:holo-[acyl-carrier protein] synthase
MAIRIGSDIVSVRRVGKVFSRRPSFSERILTQQEAGLFRERKNSMEFLAGRFAAKEAVLKALGTGLGAGLTFKDIEVIPDLSGAPSVNLYGRALEILARAGGNKVLVTISHEKDYAIAFAVVENHQ